MSINEYEDACTESKASEIATRIYDKYFGERASKTMKTRFGDLSDDIKESIRTGSELTMYALH